MATPDRHLIQAVERAWPKLAGLLARVSVLTGLGEAGLPARITRRARLQALRLLRPGEALMRRLIILMAHQLVAEGGAGLLDSVPGKAVAAGDCSGARHSYGRKRGFRLFEPTPSMASVFGPPPAPRAALPQGPGPRCLDLSGGYPHAAHGPSATVEAGVSAAGVAARLEALADAFARPGRHVRRLARRLMRRAGVRGRVEAMRPGPAPGARSGFTPVWLSDSLAHLTAEIRALPPPGTMRSLTVRLP